MKTNQPLGQLSIFVIASVAGLMACNAKTDLSAYLHKTTVTAEPSGPSTPYAAVHATASAPAAQSAAAAPAPAETVSAAALVAPTARVAPATSSIAPAAGAFASAHGLDQPVPAKPQTLQTELNHGWTGPSSAPTPPPITVPAAKKGGTRNASVGGAAVSGGNVSNAARVVASLRAGLRDCYAHETSDGVGSIRYTLSVGANGAVSNVSAAPSGDLSSTLIACATARLQAAKFEAPEGGAATIRFPVRFTVQ